MNNIQVTSVSSKGQVVIPADIRESMGITIGAKLIILTDGENLLLKPIQAPRYEDFKALFKESSKIVKKAGIKQADVKKIIKRLRNGNRS
jgi:AbrB family looped-hinge helix DNA binding protein